VTDMAHAVAAAHLQRHNMWVQVEQEQHHAAVAVQMAAAAAAAAYPQPAELPRPPMLHNLEEVADLIAAAQAVPQRESLAMFLAQHDCGYLKALLALFPSAEAKQDYGALATLAACIKTIMLLNDPAIIEFIVSEGNVYEQVCSTLEYDPDLRDKANHRWFLRERCKFRTVVLMKDEELVATIHRSFRVTYLRDTLLRPTMDESSLSTLSSLQTFTHADVVKGVTCSREKGGDSYLVQVIRMLGFELNHISIIEWAALEEGAPVRAESPEPPLVAVNATWKQHLCPQDGSLGSRKIRRRGCLSFFRELFNMVRISLQQSDKDDFYAAIVGMEVELQEMKLVNILSLLGSVLSDPGTDVTEKAAALEIIGSIAMHDPGHIRRHCLEHYELWKRCPRTDGELTGPARPYPNERRQILFRTPPNDLLASLLFLMAVETDAGLLLQTSEMMRIILDMDIMGEHGPMGGIGIEDHEGGQFGGHRSDEQHTGGDPTSLTDEGGSDQNQFLALFYEHYVHWLVAPFQYTIVYPARRFPDNVVADPTKSVLLKNLLENFKHGATKKDILLRIVSPCSTRASFAVELLSFCVRAHLYRMKFYLLRSRVLGSVLKLLGPTSAAPSGDRCLKLAALRFLRSILSVKDEFYHRHIIQHNLFGQVFEAFRANPVGDNLVSSAIVEMCDFIQGQNIKSLIEYIMTKHLSAPGPDQKTLEEVATPYVNTLTTLRKTYEDNITAAAANVAAGQGVPDENSHGPNTAANGHSRYFAAAGWRRVEPTSEKALEDQRKFRESGSEESYFDDDDDDEVDMKIATLELATEVTESRLFEGDMNVATLEPATEGTDDRFFDEDKNATTLGRESQVTNG
jgi:Component of IIS longevity pathway SMK-1